MKTTDKWMPLYLGDYTSGTLRLSTEEHGAYTLLIIDYWISGPPPDDDKTLANITKLDINRWKQMRKQMLAFFTIRGGVLRHKRIDKELKKARTISEKRRKSGLLGVKARQQTVNHLLNQTDDLRSTPSPSPSPKKNLDSLACKGNGKSKLTLSDIESGKKAAPGWDIYNIEAAFYAFNAGKKIHDLPRAWLGFVKKHTGEKSP